MRDTSLTQEDNLKYIPEEEYKNEGLFYTKVVEIA